MHSSKLCAAHSTYKSFSLQYIPRPGVRWIVQCGAAVAGTADLALQAGANITYVTTHDGGNFVTNLMQSHKHSQPWLKAQMKSDGPDITEVASKTEWAAYKTSASRQCKTMIVGFFAGDTGDYGGIGTLFTTLSADFEATWFYSVDTSQAEDLADRLEIHETPAIQVWRDGMKIETIENPTSAELEALLEKFGQRW